MITYKPRSTMEVIMEIRFNVLKARVEAEALFRRRDLLMGSTSW